MPSTMADCVSVLGPYLSLELASMLVNVDLHNVQQTVVQKHVSTIHSYLVDSNMAKPYSSGNSVSDIVRSNALAP